MVSAEHLAESFSIGALTMPRLHRRRLGNITYRLGRKLHVNPSTESFVNDPEADAMLTRQRRAPFIVPVKV